MGRSLTIKLPILGPGVRPSTLDCSGVSCFNWKSPDEVLTQAPHIPLIPPTTNVWAHGYNPKTPKRSRETVNDWSIDFPATARRRPSIRASFPVLSQNVTTRCRTSAAEQEKPDQGFKAQNVWLVFSATDADWVHYPFPLRAAGQIRHQISVCHHREIFVVLTARECGEAADAFHQVFPSTFSLRVHAADSD